jgi:hypothetical protein
LVSPWLVAKAGSTARQHRLLSGADWDSTGPLFALADLELDRLAFTELFNRRALDLGMMEEHFFSITGDESKTFVRQQLLDCTFGHFYAPNTGGGPTRPPDCEYVNPKNKQGAVDHSLSEALTQRARQRRVRRDGKNYQKAWTRVFSLICCSSRYNATEQVYLNAARMAIESVIGYWRFSRVKVEYRRQ